MNIFEKKLKEMQEGKQPEPFKHSEIPEGYTRIKVDGIEATTEKARLIIINGSRKIWIPKSVSKLHYGNNRGETEMDRNDVMDVETDFYNQTIG